MFGLGYGDDDDGTSNNDDYAATSTYGSCSLSVLKTLIVPSNCHLLNCCIPTLFAL